jgi:hypothetical protein
MDDADSGPDSGSDDPSPYDPASGDRPLETVQPSSVTARVPDSVSGGVFATGIVVLQGPTEVMIDFVQGVANPRRIARRVVLPPAVAHQFIDALESNLARYAETFGAVPREPSQVVKPAAASSAESGSSASSAGAPASPPQQQPIAEVYDHLKAPDEVLGGAYANTVSIAHTGSEFHFDFINRCFPRSVVTSRVYMAAPRVPGLLNSLKRSLRPS